MNKEEFMYLHVDAEEKDEDTLDEGSLFYNLKKNQEDVGQK